MADIPGFGVVLARLAARRRLGVRDVALEAGLAEPEVAAVLADAPPSPSLIRALAPALDLHAADLFVIAGRDVPDDLAPMERQFGGMLLSHLAVTVARLTEQHRAQLRALTRSLPQEGARPAIPPPYYQRLVPGPGRLVLRMLHNRNMNVSASAVCLYYLARVGPLSASTVLGVGRSRSALTPELTAGFAALLGIAVGDLAIMTGVDVPEDAARPAHSAAADVAGFLWDARRPTDHQVEQVDERARSHATGGGGDVVRRHNHALAYFVPVS